MQINRWNFCDDCGRLLTSFEKTHGCANCQEEYERKERELQQEEEE